MKTFNFFFAIALMVFSFSSCSLNEEERQTTVSSKPSQKADSSIDENGSTKINGDFVHMVYFWLKEPDNNAIREKFSTSLIDFVKNSEDIKSFHLGTPADTYRPIIDTSYTYCLIVTFPSKKEHDKYQVDPVHKNLLKEFKDSWEKVLIYDSESIY